MSRRLLVVLCAVAVGLLIAQAATAQPATGATSAPGEQGRPPRGDRAGMRGMGEGMINEIVKELALTGEKETQVRQILTTYIQSVGNWFTENRDKMQELNQQMREARQANDEAKIKELQAELKKLNDARLQLREDLLKQLAGVLPPEQIEKLKDFVIDWRSMLRPLLPQLNLTEEQKAKVVEIVKNWREGQEAGPAAGRFGGEFRLVVQKIVTDVILTAEQRDALAKMTEEGDFFQKVMKLNLTDVQKEQVQKISDSMRRGRQGGRQGRGGQEGAPPTGPAGGGPGPGGAGPGPGGPPPAAG